MPLNILFPSWFNEIGQIRYKYNRTTIVLVQEQVTLVFSVWKSILLRMNKSLYRHGQLECVLYLLKVNDTCDKTEIQLLNTSVK